VRQRLANRLSQLERIHGAALEAIRDREQLAETQASVDEILEGIRIWRARNSGPEHKNESLAETFARYLGITPGELRAQLMERACGGGLR
jgi:hypothetical protein